MKLRKGVPLLAALFVGVLLTYVFVANLAFAKTVEDSEAETAVSASLPIIDDFEDGTVSSWFTYGDWDGGSAITNTELLTNSLASVGTVSNTVMMVDYVSAGWGLGVGKDIIPAGDWSGYDGLSFWFYGTNSGTEFKIILTDNDGERQATKFNDDFTGWQEMQFPWQVFYWDTDFQPDWNLNDGLTLTAVEAFAFAPAPGSSGVYAMDQVRLYNDTGAVVDDYQSGTVPAWFTYGDWDGGSAITNTELLTNSLASVGTVSNTVMMVDYVSAGWGLGTGKDIIPAGDWSSYDGLSFWFYGTNSGTEFKIILTDNDGERQATKFNDDFMGWQEMQFPWQVFYWDTDFQPDWNLNDGLTLTAVEAIAFAPAVGSSGVYAMDQVKLFKTTGAVIDDYQSGTVPAWFTYGDWDGGAAITNTEELTTSLASVGTVSNTVMMVDYVSAGWGLGTGKDIIPAGDWSSYDGLSFWFYGTNSGTEFKIILTDNDGERQATKFNDDFMGWQQLRFPWQVFYWDTDFQPDWNHNDGLTLTAVEAIAFAPTPGGSGVYNIDQLSLYGGQDEEGYTTYFPVIFNNYGTMVQFNEEMHTVAEGDSVTISVTLNKLSAEPVTVSYATSDGTAVSGVDYVAANGTLTFPANTGSQSLTIDTIDNTTTNDSKTFTVTLSNPINADLGTTNAATITIEDNESVCIDRSLVIDEFENGIPSGLDGDGNEIGYVIWGDDWNGTTVTITTNIVNDADPLALPGQSGNNTLYQLDANVVGWGGTTHAFENIPVDTWTPQDWSSYELITFWLYGQNTGNTLLFEIQDNRPPSSTGNDTEVWNYTFTDDFAGWKKFELSFDEFTRKEIGNGAPDDGFNLTEVHAWAFGSLATDGADVTYYMDDVVICGTAPTKPLSVAFEQANYEVNEGETAVFTVTLNHPYTETVTVDYTTAEATAQEDRQYTPTNGTLTFTAGETTKTIDVDTIDDGKYTGDRRVVVNLHENETALGFQRRAVLTIVDSATADSTLVDDFEGFHPYINSTGNVTLSVATLMNSTRTPIPGQPAYEDVLDVEFDGASSFDRIYSQGQDWSNYDGLDFWYYGSNSGETIAMQVKDNMTATTSMVDPADWVMVWSDEFNDPAGTPPNPNVWKHELGDGALNGIVGWGNSELQYYSNDASNAATDGNGNLVIRLNEVDTDTTDLVCWYGPCEYTSARLITQDQLDFEYGRIEANVQVPTGPAGLWPAFWMLGDDIAAVDWPQAGEIDIMEYVSKEPYEVFGTLHGPGYAGGGNFGGTHTFTETVVANDYHTFGIEWSPDYIEWYVDDIHYFEAMPSDVAPNEWVYNHPFFLILNMAIGGNFGGPVDSSMTMPQETLVDYVRVYQAADTAERFEATFVDDFTGWQKVDLPFSGFSRSATQPTNAPNDGLGLTEIWGYGFVLPTATGSFQIDQVSLYMTP